MSLSTKALTRRVGRAALIAVLMSGAATVAMAAPSAKDVKIETMQRQLDELTAQMAQLRSQNGGSAQLDAVQAQLADFAKQLQDIKDAQSTASADIITLKAPPPVAASLPNGRPSLASSDGRFTANIKAIVMFDAAKYYQKNNLPAAVTNRDLNDGTNFRRARFGVEGRLFKDFDYNLIYEFGGSGLEDSGHIQEAWIQYTAFKPWRIRLGAFEPNIGLAAAVSTSQMPIMERPAPAEVARNVAAGDSRSAIQVAGNGIWGAGDSGVAVRWLASGALTGNTLNTLNTAGGFAVQPADEQTAIIGRFAIAPFDSTNWQAHLGINGQKVTQPNDAGAAVTPRYPIQLRDRPELRVDGTRLVDTGGIDAKGATVLGLEAAAQVQNFLVESEYFKYTIDRRNSVQPDPKFNGWYVQGVWVLTGETRPYNPAEGRFDAPKLNYNFNPAAGTWGAFEIAARYSNLDLNFREGAGGTAALASAIRGGEQKISTIGLNWYLNPSIRMMFDWQHVDINRYNAAGVQVGQKYNAVAMRSQFNF